MTNKNVSNEYIAHAITIHGLETLKNCINENMEVFVNTDIDEYEFKGFTVSVEWNSLNENDDEYLNEDKNANFTLYKQNGNIYVIIDVYICTAEDDTRYVRSISVSEVGLINADDFELI